MPDYEAPFAKKKGEGTDPGAGAYNIVQAAQGEGMGAYTGGDYGYWEEIREDPNKALWEDPGVVQAGGIFAPAWAYGDVGTQGLLAGAESYARAAEMGRTQAQRQLAAGLRAGQQDLRGMATVRGYSPAAMRSAQIAGAGIAAGGTGQAAALRAEEMLQAERLRQQALAAAQQQALARGGLLAQRYGVEQGATGTLAGLTAAEQAAAAQRGSMLGGAIMSGAGALLGQASGYIPQSYDPTTGEFSDETWGGG
jgi:hypothetical protein